MKAMGEESSATPPTTQPATPCCATGHAALSPLVEAVAERSRERLSVQDRLDALDELSSTATRATLARDQPAIVEALVEEALDDVLAALAVRANRHKLRSLVGGVPQTGLEALMQAGLVIDSWTGDAPRTSAVAGSLVALLDEVRAAAVASVRRSLGRDGER